MPDVSIPEDVEQLGRLPSPDEIGQQIAALTLRVAEAQRIVLESQLEVAKLLALLTEQHGYKGRQFSDFATAHGVATRTDAYDLVKIADKADEVIAEHEAATQDDPRHGWPSWREVWRIKQQQTKKRYWITPPDIYQRLNDEFQFDHDPCPYPRPPNLDSLADDVEWGESNYVNAPFRQDDVVGGTGPTAFVNKGLCEQTKAKTSVFVLPVPDYMTKFLLAGAEIRPLGRVPFLEVETGEPAPHPPNIACFILRGHKKEAESR